MRQAGDLCAHYTDEEPEAQQRLKAKLQRQEEQGWGLCSDRFHHSTLPHLPYNLAHMFTAHGITGTTQRPAPCEMAFLLQLLAHMEVLQIESQVNDKPELSKVRRIGVLIILFLLRS